MGVAPGEIKGDAGWFQRTADPDTGNAVYNIYTNNKLPPRQIPIATAHEVAHAIDTFAGTIPTTGLSKELGPLYNTMVTGQERKTALTRPTDIGYSADDAPREQMAEAIRAYMTNPNYLKAVAPDTAERIRAAVNANPRLARIIQFNSAAGLAAGAGAAGLATTQQPAAN